MLDTGVGAFGVNQFWSVIQDHLDHGASKGTGESTLATDLYDRSFDSPYTK